MDMGDWLNLTISLVALIFSASSLLFVIFQVLGYFRQLRFDAISRIVEINRELILAALEHPDLLAFLDGESPKDPRVQRRYFQLWLNQIQVMWHAKNERLLDSETWSGHQVDFRTFVALPGFRAHWGLVRMYYNSRFAAFIDAIKPDEMIGVEKIELPRSLHENGRPGVAHTKASVDAAARAPRAKTLPSPMRF